jgi:hypothetical protein
LGLHILLTHGFFAILEFNNESLEFFAIFEFNNESLEEPAL